MNAFRVFETLNARGVQLSSADLLKNYFFSLVDDNSSHNSRINHLDDLWERLTSIIQTRKLPDFIRYYWNCSHKSVRSAELFKVVKSEIKTDKDVFTMVNGMIKYADIFMALQDPNDETWERNRDVAYDIRLLKLLRIRSSLCPCLWQHTPKNRSRILLNCCTTPYLFALGIMLFPTEILTIWKRYSIPLRWR